MRKSIIIGLTAAVIGAGTLAVGVAQADRGWGERCDGEGGKGKHHQMSDRMGRHMEKRLDYLSEELNLTEQQQDSIEEMHDQQRLDMFKQMRSMRGFKKQMQDLDVSAADYDQQVEALIAEAQEKAETLIRGKAEQKKAVYALLTPEQQEKFNQLGK